MNCPICGIEVNVFNSPDGIDKEGCTMHYEPVVRVPKNDYDGYRYTYNEYLNELKRINPGITWMEVL